MISPLASFRPVYIARPEVPENNLAPYLAINARQGSYHGDAAAGYIRCTF